MKRKIIFILSILSLLIGCTPTTKPTENNEVVTKTVVFKATGDFGEELNQVQVVVYNKDHNQVGKYSTNQKGLVLVDLELGEYTIECSKELYEDQTLAFTLHDPIEISIQMNQIQEKELNAWEEEYINVINQIEEQYASDALFHSSIRYALVNINNDEIPELVVHYISEADGSEVFTYLDGKIISQELRRNGFFFLEGSGKFCNSDGHMGLYYDYIYELTDHGFKRIGEGTYFEEPYGSGPFKYQWNEKEVSKDEYYSYLNGLIDQSQSIDDYDLIMEKDEIIAKLAKG